MTDESAAGPKTDNFGDRCERVAGVMEKRLADCGGILGDCMRAVAKNGGYRESDMREIATFLKIGAQLAGQIARLETVKNRNSKAMLSLTNPRLGIEFERLHALIRSAFILRRISNAN